MSSRDTAPSSTFMDNWSGSILCSRNRPMYRCSRYRQHLFWMFSVQKLNHDIVCGSCKVFCGVYVISFFLFVFDTRPMYYTQYILYTYYNMYIYIVLFIVYCVGIAHAHAIRCPGLGVQTLAQVGI